MREMRAPAADALTTPAVFLAGGISGCGDWQAEAVAALDDVAHGVLVNPRREQFDLADGRAARAQIQWEHERLRAVDAILFWFPDATLCPIALYELGAWSMTRTPLFVGTAPEYARRTDVIEQTALARPDVVVRKALGDVVDDLRRWLSGQSAAHN